MAIEIPSEVAFFLNMCGIPYPDVNEDDVRALAGHVRTFADQVRETHDAATGVIGDMGSVYSGYSYEQLVASWARMSSSHRDRLEDACAIVEKALYTAAQAITVIKLAVLAELAALAAAYLSVLATPPLAPLGPTVAAAARRLCDQMRQALLGYVLAELVDKAIEPLERAVDDMIEGIVYDAARQALGVPAPGLHIEPDEVRRYAELLDDHADDIMRHAASFAENAAALDFGAPTRSGGATDPQASERFSSSTHPAEPPDSTTPARSPAAPSANSVDPPVTSLGSPVSATGPSTSPAGLSTGSPRRSPNFAGPQGDRTGMDAAREERRPLVRADEAEQRSSPHRDRAAETQVSGASGTAREASAGGGSSGGGQDRPSVSVGDRFGHTGDPGRVSGAPRSSANGEGGDTRDSPAADRPRGDSLPAGSPATDPDLRRPSWLSPSVLADTPPLADPAAPGNLPGGTPPRWGAAQAAVTPWGRPGRRPRTPHDAPPASTQSRGDRVPEARAPGSTPWTKSRRSVDVPAVAAPATSERSARLLRGRHREAGRDDRTDTPGTADRTAAAPGAAAEPGFFPDAVAVDPRGTTARPSAAESVFPADKRL